MKPCDVVIAVIVTLLWGFNFVVVEIGLESFPPMFFSALRFVCAAFPAVLIWGRGDVQWRWIVSVGITLGTLMFGLLFIGMNVGMPAGLSSLVLQIQVVFTLILSGLVLRDRPTVWQQVGIAVAFAGIGLLVVHKFEGTSFAGLMLVIAAGLAWAVANIQMKQCGQIDMFRLIVWMSLVPPIPLLILSWIFERGHAVALQSISLTGLGAILYTGLISTVLTFGIWARLLKKYSPNQVAPFALLVPIFGILSAFMVLGETLTGIELTASCLVFGGLFLVVLGPRLTALVTSGRAAIRPE